MADNLKRKRIYTDFFLKLGAWKDESHTAAVDFTNAVNLKLFVRKSNSSNAVEQTFTRDDNYFSFQWSSLENVHLGLYSVYIAWDIPQSSSETSYCHNIQDFTDCFEIVKSSELETNIDTILNGSVQSYASDGHNAYSPKIVDGVWWTYDDATNAYVTTGISVTGSNTEVDFTESTERTNLVSGSTLSTLFGKVKKWFSDLKAVAFSGSYNDLSDKPSNLVTDTELSTALSGKVDVVEGKGLSTNDYTTTEKQQVSNNKDTNTLQDTVTAEAITKLINEINALKKIITSGNLGDVHATSLTTDSVPQYCGQNIIVKGSGSPVTNQVVPDFEGQVYVDTTNRNAYMCTDSSSYSYWKLLN